MLARPPRSGRWPGPALAPPTMYMGEPQSVAAIMLLCRYRAKPKSAADKDTDRGAGPPRPRLLHPSHSAPVPPAPAGPAPCIPPVPPLCPAPSHPLDPPDPPPAPLPPRRPGLTNLDADVVGVGAAPTGIGQQDVLGLQVSVDDALAVQKPHGPCDLLQEEPDGVLAECPHGCGETTGRRGYSSPSTRVPAAPAEAGSGGLGIGHGLGCAAPSSGRPLTVQVVSQVPAVAVLQESSSTPISVRAPAQVSSPSYPACLGACLLPAAGVPCNPGLKRSTGAPVTPRTSAVATWAPRVVALRPQTLCGLHAQVTRCWCKSWEGPASLT